MERLPYSLCKPVWDALKWEPAGPEQAEPLLDDTERFPCIVGGERGGKSTLVTIIATPHILAIPMLRYDTFFYPNGKVRFNPKVDRPRNPHFVIFGPTYKETHVEFEYIENQLRALGKLCEAQVSKPTQGAWRLVTTDGVVGQTFSLEDPESVRAMTLEFALVVEAGGCPYTAIERIRGRVTTTRGFIVYSGTIETSNQWWKDWLLEGSRPNEKGIKSYSIPSWANRHEFPGGEKDPEIVAWRKFLGEDLFLERCAAQAQPTKARVLKEVTKDHIQVLTEVPGDANFEAWVDPGYASAYAVLKVAWWWEDDPEEEGERRKFFYFYDELYEQGKTTEVVIDLAKKDRFWNKMEKGWIDISAKAHQANKSVLEIWEEKTHIKFEYGSWKEDRLIERINHSALHYQFLIHPRCKGLIAEAGLGEPVFQEMHPWKFPTDRDNRVIGEKPIDRWNHTSKAVCYGLLGHLGQVKKRGKARAIRRIKQVNPFARPLARKW